MARHNRTGRSKGEVGRFAALPLAIAETQAWRDLSGTAAKAWMAILFVYNGSNNGTLAISARALGERIGVHYTAAARALVELENAGFLRQTKPGEFQKRRAAEYRLTHRPCDKSGEAATHDYKRPKIAVNNVVPLPAKGA